MMKRSIWACLLIVSMFVSFLPYNTAFAENEGSSKERTVKVSFENTKKYYADMTTGDISDTFEVKNDSGKDARLLVYQYVDGNWKKRYTCVAPTGIGNVTVTYKKKHFAKESKKNAYYTSIYKIKAVDENGKTLNDPEETHTEIVYDKTYIAPEGYYQPQSETPKFTADYDLTVGVMGLKVRKVQRKLGISDKKAYYKSTLETAVKNYQKKNGLKATGVVDLATWKKLGLSEKEWNTLGAYVHPNEAPENATANELNDKFLEIANSYLGTEYIVGAAGPVGSGVDCSGFVLQCLYGIGIYPDCVDVITHSTTYEYGSYEMWKDPKFVEISKSELKPGDLVFYDQIAGLSDSDARPVDHIAIYIGNDKCIQAFHGVEIKSINLSKNYKIRGYKRVIARQ